jgi:hypothetical protein
VPENFKAAFAREFRDLAISYIVRMALNLSWQELGLNLFLKTHAA